MAGIVATAETEIAATPDRVWAALTEPDQIKQYFFGTTVDTDWNPGSPITWSGEYEGKSYEDKGKVIAVDGPRQLVVTHFSPMSGQDDVPENYHTLTYTLSERGDGTRVELSQDNNGSDEEAEQATATWQQLLDALKKHVEGQS
jgi:uncharacterized protein YndB with AHSA1/START domain